MMSSNLWLRVLSEKRVVDGRRQGISRLKLMESILKASK